MTLSDIESFGITVPLTTKTRGPLDQIHPLVHMREGYARELTGRFSTVMDGREIDIENLFAAMGPQSRKRVIDIVDDLLNSEQEILDSLPVDNSPLGKEIAEAIYRFLLQIPYLEEGLPDPSDNDHTYDDIIPDWDFVHKVQEAVLAYEDVH
jgi:hypothetical protein